MHKIDPCFMPGAKAEFSSSIAAEHLAALHGRRLNAVVQVRTVGNNWWRTGTDGGLISSTHKVSSDSHWAAGHDPWPAATLCRKSSRDHEQQTPSRRRSSPREPLRHLADGIPVVGGGNQPKSAVRRAVIDPKSSFASSAPRQTAWVRPIDQPHDRALPPFIKTSTCRCPCALRPAASAGVHLAGRSRGLSHV